MNELAVLKNIPVSTAAIASLYPDVKSANRKVASLEKAGRLIRLKRGLYVVSPQESGLLLSLNLIGNVLYGPSYVSMLTALREYGLIPERVEVVESMTTHLRFHFKMMLDVLSIIIAPRTIIPLVSLNVRKKDCLT